MVVQMCFPLQLATKVIRGSGLLLIEGMVGRILWVDHCLRKVYKLNFMIGVDKLDKACTVAHFLKTASFWQQNNTYSHVMWRTLKFLENAGIERMGWPAFELNSNAIEHVWHMTGSQVRARNPPVNSLVDLSKKRLQVIYDSTPQEHICALINRMPRWLAAVIKAHGSNMCY